MERLKIVIKNARSSRSSSGNCSFGSVSFDSWVKAQQIELEFGATSAHTV